LGGYDLEEIPDAEQMAGLANADLDEPLRLLMGVCPDVVVYGCTSATLALGIAFDRTLADRIADGSGAYSITAAGALVFALESLAVKRIAFASPYVPALNDDAIEFLGNAGIETVSRADVTGQLDNYGQGRLTPDEVFSLGLKADSAEAEALVLSCTDMRAVETIERLEDAIGKAVITSNQAMMFQAMKLLGLQREPVHAGRLFDCLETGAGGKA
jgi:maleate isomerase/arylmalonate decarboxylase